MRPDRSGRVAHVDIPKLKRAWLTVPSAPSPVGRRRFTIVQPSYRRLPKIEPMMNTNGISAHHHRHATALPACKLPHTGGHSMRGSPPRAMCQYRCGTAVVEAGLERASQEPGNSAPISATMLSWERRAASGA